MSDLNIEDDVELQSLDKKQTDVLALIRRWSKQLKILSESDVKLVLHYLNEKHGPK